MKTLLAEEELTIYRISGQSPAEERVNSLIHGAGALLSMGGVSVLVIFASLYGNVWHIVSCSIYGTTLILLYVVSTWYHASRSLHRKQVLQVADHACIYLLIAGSYTPFTIVIFPPEWGWSLFGVEWGLAAAGIIMKMFFVNRFNTISTLVYLGMGWLIVIAIFPLVEYLSRGGLIWLFLGGVAYTAGTPFYLWEKIPFSHAIWHVFVLTGSICHYFAIFFHVLPPF
ncbi:MAG: hemolysin III family protein [SAR324 cluster bacterium]|nr:hemolysin III family protein [SAR324 cluster bacterium]